MEPTGSTHVNFNTSLSTTLTLLYLDAPPNLQLVQSTVPPLALGDLLRNIIDLIETGDALLVLILFSPCERADIGVYPTSRPTADSPLLVQLTTRGGEQIVYSINHWICVL